MTRPTPFPCSNELARDQLPFDRQQGLGVPPGSYKKSVA